MSMHFCMSMHYCIWYLVFLCWQFLFLYSCMFHLPYVRVPGMSALWSCCPGFVEMGAVCCEGCIPNFLKTRSRLLHAYRSHRLGCLLLTLQFEIMWFVLLKTACICSVRTRAIRCRHRWRQGHTQHLVCEFVLTDWQWAQSGVRLCSCQSGYVSSLGLPLLCAFFLQMFRRDHAAHYRLSYMRIQWK